jgi:L-ascorbate metabolism protein UlaG (beta-lactamase superfamily)
MNGRLFTTILGVTFAGVFASPQRPAPDAIPTPDGDITISPIAHAAVYIAHGQNVILIDPARFGPGLPPPPPPSPELIAQLQKMPPKGPDGEPPPETTASALPLTPEQMVRFKGLKEPTLILVTDIHDDHLDPRVIAAVKRASTRLIVPRAAMSRLLGVQGAEAMSNGETRRVRGTIVEAVPMYNPQPDAKFGLVFHPKGRGNGYVLTIGGKRIYIAGDTGCTTEIQTLKSIDVAFLPISLPSTMSPSDAAECAKAFRPRVVYPYHYFESDPKVFEAALRGTAIEVRLRDWYLGKAGNK